MTTGLILSGFIVGASMVAGIFWSVAYFRWLDERAEKKRRGRK